MINFWIIIISWLIAVLPLTCWTSRTLEFWLTYVSGHVVHTPFWLDLLVTFFGSGVTFVLNIISEIARLAVN